MLCAAILCDLCASVFLLLIHRFPAVMPLFVIFSAMKKSKNKNTEAQRAQRKSDVLHCNPL
jgi:hypothetical protein